MGFLKLIKIEDIDSLALNISKQTRFSYSAIHREIMQFNKKHMGYSSISILEDKFLKDPLFEGMTIEKLKKS